MRVHRTNSSTVAWVLLVVSGMLETVWAIGMKRSEGFTKLGPSVFTLVTMGIGFYLLGYATKTLPIGTAYAIWVGIGAIGTATVGMVFLGEPRTVLRLVSIGLILAGVVGLRLGHK